MEEENIPAYDEITGKGLIRHILTKVGFVTGEKLVCIVVNGNSIPNKEKLIDRLKTVDGLTGVVLNINKSKHKCDTWKRK